MTLPSSWPPFEVIIMWVQLKTVQYIEEHGQNVTYHPGDWVNVGKQQARLWLSRGDAVLPGDNGHKVGVDAGAIVQGSLGVAQRVLEIYSDLDVEEAPPSLVYNRTMVWDTSLAIQRELVAVGFSLLDTWEIAVPLYDYQVLASSVGKMDEQDRTKDVIKDLRVPLYDTRLIFAQRCPNTVNIFARWRNDVLDGDDSMLSFLRAVYTVKPYILALPTTWTDRNAPR